MEAEGKCGKIFPSLLFRGDSSGNEVLKWCSREVDCYMYHVAGRRCCGNGGICSSVPLCAVCGDRMEGGTMSCCCPHCTGLQLAFPSDTRLLPLLPVGLLNSSQELELDLSLFLLECLTATYSGLTL